MTIPRVTITHRCVCGREVPGMPTESAYEFTWRCVCGSTGVISFAHAHPPPVYRDRPAAQGELFSVAGER